MLPTQLYLCHARRARGHRPPFAERAKSEPGWRYYEIDAGYSPAVTAPEALLLQKIVTARGRRSNKHAACRGA
jgi:hypothetical protein